MRIIITLTIVTLLYACQQRPVFSGDTGGPVVTDTSLSGKWVLSSGLDTMSSRETFISFGPALNTFTGNSGCNHMGGTYARNGNIIQFDDRIILTKMACPGYNEQQFIHKLTSANNFVLSGNTLQLRKDSIAVLIFKR